MTDAYDITWAAGSTVGGRRKNNWTATVAPGSGDDSADGYEVGSVWVNVNNDDAYICADATATSAVWLHLNAGVSDHGALTGLADDDHPQYIKDSEYTATGDILVGTGAGTFVARQNNDSASTAPTVSDDNTAGYAIGSRWLDTTNDKEYVATDVSTGAATWVDLTAGGGGGAPTTVDYLVGTADGTLTNEIVVGTTPGGELGGTWASPTVDSVHSGSAHHDQSHAIDGGDHTLAGATIGHVLRASGATTFAFAQLQHSDLGGVGIDDHHARDHDIEGATHTATGLTIGHVLRASGATTFAFAALQASDIPALAYAPDDADYLVGTANGGLSAEIVVGTTPGGELGGTWASPTVDSVHSGSAHHAQSHVLATGTALGPDHTISGAAAGEVLRALSATTAAFDVLQHGDLGGVGTDDHHAQAHAINGADHTGTLAHSALGGITSDDHHNQSHDHSAAGDGTTLSPATLNLPSTATPAQTAEGQVVWDSDDDVLTVGDGVGRSTFGKLGATTPDAITFGQAGAAGSSVEASRADHAHAMAADPVPAHEAAGDPHPGYRLESADHTHASTGLQGGLISHDDLTGVSVDDHHNEAHVVNSTGPHAESGLTIGHVLRASGAAAFGFAALQASDIPALDYAPTNVDYLVGTASGALSAEIVVGTAPGGELGGTWASPTVDSVHSGSAHHTQSHDHSAAGDGTSLSPATFIFPGSTTPAQTAEGSAVWDTDTDVLTVGDGVARKTFGYMGTTNPSTQDYSDAPAPGTSVEMARIDHVHGMPAAGSGAPADADYLVGTTNAGLSAEIVVGTTPGGELGGTWASPTVDSVHSGSAHHSQSHAIDGGDHTASGLTIGHVLRATGATTFAFAAIQAGDLPSIDHGSGLTGLGDDDHPHYFLADGSRDLSGNLLLSVDSTHNIGTSAVRVATGYADVWDGAQVHTPYLYSVGTTPGPSWEMYAADAGPTDTDDNDVLGWIGFHGYASADYRNAGGVTFRQDGAVSGTNVPGEFAFGTNNGTGFGDRWLIRAAGHLEPGATGVYNIGSSSLRVDEFFVGDIDSDSTLLYLHSTINRPAISFERESGVVANGETMRQGFFGNGFETGRFTAEARINAPASSDSPGALIWWTTPDGTDTPVKRWEIAPGGAFHPTTDSAVDIGTASLRPATIYADAINSAGNITIGADVITEAEWTDLTDGSATTLHTHAGGGGAPTDADYLVGTANGTLTNEIVVGTAPGGELGGTWASPTVDATHSGSSHAALPTQTANIDVGGNSIISGSGFPSLGEWGTDAGHSWSVYSNYISSHWDGGVAGVSSYHDFYRRGTAGAAIADNFVIHEWEFYGADDGAGTVPAADIKVRIDGTVATDDLPTEIVFATNGGSNNWTERWRFAPDGTFEPMADSTYNVGSTSFVPANVFADTIRATTIQGLGSINSQATTVRTAEVRSADSSQLVIRSGSMGAVYLFDGHDIWPQTDDASDLGSDTLRFNSGWFGTGGLDVEGADLVMSFLSDTETDSAFTRYERYAANGTSVITDNDELGGMSMWGWDGAALRRGAAIFARIDGTPAASNMPTELAFLVNDGAANATEVMRLTKDGNLEPEGFGLGLGQNVGAWFNPWGTVYSQYLEQTARGNALIPLLRQSRTRDSGAVVVDGDEIGVIEFMGGDDGSYGVALGARIRAIVDGTPGSNDMPTEIVFGTSGDGTQSGTDRWSIRSTGVLEPVTDDAYDVGSTTKKVRTVRTRETDSPETNLFMYSNFI